MADVPQAVQAAQGIAGLLQLSSAGAVLAGTAGADLSNGLALASDLGALARCVLAIGIIQAASHP